MLSIDRERRDGHRISLTRPCKLFEPRSRRYVGGTTCNVGPGGLLLRLDHAVALETGDRVYVAIAHRRSCLLRAREMMEAKVVRAVGTTSGETAVAVAFRDPAEETFLPVRRAA